MQLSKYNVNESLKAQLKLCNDKKMMCFSPENGTCWHCHLNIYSENGFTTEQAGNELITYCPFCHYSFLE